MAPDLILYNREQLDRAMWADPMWSVPWRREVDEASAQLDEKIARLEAGESYASVFPDSISPGELLCRIYDENPSMPARYRLPKHWHWMGDR